MAALITGLSKAGVTHSVLPSPSTAAPGPIIPAPRAAQGWSWPPETRRTPGSRPSSPARSRPSAPTIAPGSDRLPELLDVHARGLEYLGRPELGHYVEGLGPRREAVVRMEAGAKPREDELGEGQEGRRAAVDFALVVLDPADLVDRVHGVKARPGNLVHALGAEPLAEGLCLLGAAPVDVEDRLAQGPSVRAHRHHRLPEGGDADSPWRRRLDLGGGAGRAGDYLPRRAPDSLRVYLFHARTRRREGVGAVGLPRDPALLVEDARLAARGSYVDAEDAHACLRAAVL